MEENHRNRSDEDLMELYQGGDSAAFECLYRRHSGRVFEYLQRKAPAGAAQDLLQETFLKIHRSRAQYSAQYPFLPWLFTVSKNILLDHLKSAESKLERAATHSPQLIDRLPSAAAEASAGVDFSSVLASLPVQQRRAIELRYLSEWSFEKIAAEMKTTPENTRQIMSRGLKKIRSLIPGGQE